MSTARLVIHLSNGMFFGKLAMPVAPARLDAIAEKLHSTVVAMQNLDWADTRMMLDLSLANGVYV